MPCCLVCLRAVPNSFDQLYIRDAVLCGERLSELAGVLADVVRAAAGYGEVVAADGYRTTVNLRQTHHIGAGGELDQVAFVIELGRAHHWPGLKKTAGVNHLLYALTYGIATSAMLTLDTLRASQLGREPAHIFHVVNGLLPGHSRLPHVALLIYWHSCPPVPG